MEAPSARNDPKRGVTLAACVLLLGLAFSACVQRPVGRPEPVEFERIPHEAQVAETVSQYPTSFTLSSRDHAQLQKRFDIFMKLYLPESRKMIENKGSGVTRTLSRSPAPVAYQFIVESLARPSEGTYDYFVRCLPRSASASERQADLNARNLSRFLVEGTLERSLLQVQ